MRTPEINLERLKEHLKSPAEYAVLVPFALAGIIIGSRLLHNLVVPFVNNLVEAIGK